jgi:hypothetical protein
MQMTKGHSCAWLACHERIQELRESVALALRGQSPQCLDRRLGGSHRSSGYDDDEKSQLPQIKPWPSNIKFITLLTAIMIWPKQLHSKIVIKHFLLALVTHQCDCTGILMTCMHTCWCWCLFYEYLLFSYKNQNSKIYYYYYYM